MPRQMCYSQLWKNSVLIFSLFIISCGSPDSDQTSGVTEQSDAEKKVESTAEKESTAPAFRPIDLHAAVELGPLEAIETFIDEGADPNEIDEKGLAPIHRALISNQPSAFKLAIVKLLVKKGADPNIKGTVLGSQEIAPLHITSRFGEIDIAGFLIDAGADINQGAGISHPMGVEGRTPLYVALSFQANYKEPMVEFLISKGADVNKKTKGGTSPLEQAVFSGEVQLTKMIMEHSGDVNMKSEFGDTLLRYAVLSGEVQLVKMFMEHGGDVHKKDKSGGTLLQIYPTQPGHYETFKFLISQNLDVNLKGSRNRTPLHGAAWQGNREVVELLLSEGAKVNVKTDPGNTPLHLAAKQGHKKVVELLIGRGAEVNVSNKKGETPLQGAIEKKHSAVVDLLKRHGAE